MRNYRHQSLIRLTAVSHFLRWIVCGFLAMVLILWISPKAIAVSLPSIQNPRLVSAIIADTEWANNHQQLDRRANQEYVASVFSNWIELYLKKAKAPVTLDGQEIFFVTDTPEYPAEVRAQLISEKLEAAVNSENPVEVKVDQSNNHLTIISLNNEQLLTVTASDAAPKTPEERGQEWADRIQDSLSTGKQQRRFDFILKGLIYSAAIVISAIAFQSVSDKFFRQFWQKFQPSSTTENSEPPNQFKYLDLCRTLTIAIARLLIWFFAALGISNLFPLTRQWSYLIINALITTLTRPPARAAACLCSGRR